MNYVDRLIQNEKYLETMGQIHEMERQRIYCHHGFNHLLDVARIAYLINLEMEFGYEKEFLYLCALLHDIGRAKEYSTGVSHEKAGVELVTLSNYSAMIKAAVKTRYIKESDEAQLQLWREDPENWTPSELNIE